VLEQSAHLVALGQVDWQLAVAVAEHWVGAMRDEAAHHVDKVAADGGHQRRPAFVVLCVNVGAVLQQELNQLQVLVDDSLNGRFTLPASTRCILNHSEFGFFQVSRHFYLNLSIYV